MLYFRLPIISAAILSLFVSFTVKADDTTTTTTVVEKHITTPAPKAVCSAVPGHWEGNIWIDTHQLCRYENRSEGAAWVAEYWSCTAVTADGACTSWVLVPGHWIKTLN